MDKVTDAKIKRMKPFNIGLLNLNNDNEYRLLGKITSTQMFTGANYKFHPEGLWSNELFGNIGTPERMTREGYLDLNVTVLHPLVYKELINASSLVKDIMDGKTYAIFDKETKFFVKSNAIEGDTGFEFFMQHFKEMQLPSSGSGRRDSTIDLIEKHFKDIIIDKVLVIPTGYRDVEFKNGQVTHDEVNQIYREILSLTSSISSFSHKSNLLLINNTRIAIQKAVLKLYLYLADITGNGKKKLILGKWASRTVFNSTANVITAMKPSGRIIGDSRNVGYNDILVGLFQQLVGCQPYAIRGFKESFLAEKFSNPLEPVKLVNKKTLRSEEVYVDQAWFDLFTSTEGIKKLIQRFKPQGVHHRHVEIDGKYLSLIYKGKDGTFKLLDSISDLPSHLSKEDVTPLTFIELMYICTAHYINMKPGFVTRYPITGIESNVPGFCKVLTTTIDEERVMLNDNWEVDETKDKFDHFPIYNSESITSLAPPISALGGQGGDFDGDQESLISPLTEEAIDEMTEYKMQKRAYVGPDGSLRYSLDYDTITFVCKNLSVFEGTPE